MIIVFGPISMDVSMQVAAFPAPGENAHAATYETYPSGRGANQALASARSGVKTAIVGKIGDDGAGARILNNLRRQEVMTTGVATSETLPTGLTCEMRDDSGARHLVIAAGANSEVSSDQVPDEILRPGNMLVVQTELALAETLDVMTRAKARGATVLLNLAPAVQLPQRGLELVDYLVVNEPEARQIAEIVGLSRTTDLSVIAKTLSAKGDLDCIVTLGAQGAVAMTQKGPGWRVPAHKIDKVVDDTAAADCFCGTLAAALHNKLALGSAMRRASIAASMTCTKRGAQDSFPFLADIEELLEGFPQAQPC